MKIHLAKTCSAFDYKDVIIVNKCIYRDGRVMIRYLNKELVIPFNNILALESDL